MLKISNETHNKIGDLEYLLEDSNNLTEIHKEIVLANKNVGGSNFDVSIIAVDTFNFPNPEDTILEESICINRWTTETSQASVNNLADKNCQPSPENLKKSSIFLLKVVQELSESDQKINEEIKKIDREMMKLKEELRKYKHNFG